MITLANSRGEKLPRIVIDPSNLAQFLGKPTFVHDPIYREPTVGVAHGLAYTTHGGALIYLESVFSEPGSPSIKMTGQMGEVMAETVHVAHTFARNYVSRLDPARDLLEQGEIHISSPEFVPKEGPSAGVTVASSLVSLALDRPLRADVGMSGEISLHGQILRVRGIKTKTIAARRFGLKTLIFPRANLRDWEELEDFIKEGINVHFVENFDEVPAIVFEGWNDLAN